jgi:cytochrome b561
MKEAKYTPAARALHWLIAILIATALGFALSFDGLPLSPRKIRLINYHKWAGLSVLWLVAVRFAWRLTHRPPELPGSMSALQRKAAGTAHAVLYLLMGATPMIGWALSSAKGFPLAYLGVVPLPDLLAKDKATAEVLQLVHGSCAWTLIALAAAHAAVALKHHFVDRDDVLRRML